ncbi:MAG: hypothetical protein ACR2F6_18220 [Mycobacteriales bacterium]
MTPPTTGEHEGNLPQRGGAEPGAGEAPHDGEDADEDARATWDRSVAASGSTSKRRTSRCRSQERAELAAHVHDSVLQPCQRQWGGCNSRRRRVRHLNLLRPLPPTTVLAELKAAQAALDRAIALVEPAGD